MADIALEAFHANSRVKLQVEIGGDLARDLERYKLFYKQAYGADVSEAELLREMARRFMEIDRQFQVAKHGLKARVRVRRSEQAPLEAEEKQP